MPKEISVLLIEDESSIRKFITINLNRDGLKAIEAASGEEGIEIFNRENPEVVILDVMLPGIDGFEVCQRIRKVSLNTIIIMLTARSMDMDKIMGLELGADDYMVKPFNPLELVARIRAILRRGGTNNLEDINEIQDRELKIDFKSQKVFKEEKEVEVTPREFSILKFFMENPDTALSRDALLNNIWGRNYFGDIKTVDVHIRRLREKIEDNPSKPEHIETVWGYGYRWRKG